MKRSTEKRWNPNYNNLRTAQKKMIKKENKQKSLTHQKCPPVKIYSQ